MEGDRKGVKDESRLADKLLELEEKMKLLQQNLMDEKLKLNRDRGGEGDELPDNWASMNRLHLPQCPLAKVATSTVNKPLCPVHGHAVRANGMNTRSLPHLPAKKENSVVCESERYSKLISEAEKFSRLDNVNDKFRELYNSSMFSPTFYRPRIRSQGPSIEKDLERRLVRFAHDSSFEEVSTGTGFPVTNDKSYDSLEDLSITRNSSTGNSRSERCSDITFKEESHLSEDESSADIFNPFHAIESVRNKFLDIESFVNEASNKTRIKETT